MHGPVHGNTPQKAHRQSRQVVGTVILCALLLGFSIDLRTPQGARGILRAAAQANMTQQKTVTIPIEGGMACMLCVGRVKKTLKALDGVLEVVVSLEHRYAHVRYLETAVSPECLVAAINSLGYIAGTPTVEHTP